MEPLEVLKNVVANMPDVTPGKIYNNLLELESKKGLGYAINLFNRSEIGIVDTVISENSEFPIHYHKQKEYFIVYEGIIHLWLGEEHCKNKETENPIVLNVGDVQEIKPNVLHIVGSVIKARFITITIPVSPGFPH